MIMRGTISEKIKICFEILDKENKQYLTYY